MNNFPEHIIVFMVNKTRFTDNIFYGKKDKVTDNILENTKVLHLLWPIEYYSLKSELAISIVSIVVNKFLNRMESGLQGGNDS